VCIRYRGNVFTELLPSNDRGILIEPLPSNNRVIFTKPLPSNDRMIFTVALPNNDRGDAQTNTQTDGRDTLITPLRWAQLPWYTYQVS
jgi:hypothetical protein